MGALQSFLSNFACPRGLGGRLVLNAMNIGHEKGAKIARGCLQWQSNWSCLDIGCGGGRNLQAMLSLCPDGQICGVDISEAAVQKSLAHNREAVKNGQLTVLKGDVHQLPFETNRFDMVTAFETIYFWEQLPQAFKEVNRVLKSKGQFLIMMESAAVSSSWATRVPGMKVPDAKIVRESLIQAGFRSVTLFENTDPVIVFLAKK